MSYTRKTKDYWNIETNYGYGWETEASYDKKSDAQKDLKEYMLHAKHYNGNCRIVKRREQITA